MRLLKTLHIDSEMGWGGGQRQVTGLCCYLRDRGHEVKLVCRPGSELQAWASSEGIDAISVDMKCALSLATVFRMRSVIGRERPDVVHLHASKAHVLGSAAARLAGGGLGIATRRMQDPIRMIWPNTSAYGHWTDALVAISNTARDALLAAGVKPEKIHVIESGVDVDTFADAPSNPEFRAGLGVDDRIPIVCTTAVLSERKGIRYLIEAAALLRQAGVPFRLIIAGDGPDRDNLETQARELGLAAQFLGFREDVPLLLAEADVFVMPSLSEGLGVATLEAMAAGRPVVASAVGGLCESVVDGVTGILVPPRDPRSLANAIGKLLENPDMARKLGAAGQERIRARYSLSSMAARNEALYYELLGK
ncbi:MAG: hypothetical protein A2Z18_04575 [Armatimonadetes bacterium RBG_16_58_9]|nr:MAG: hypothetical protein A2Z18_04575 [Armatimonadetes bacterium RBG_16_58_9]